MSRPRTTFRRSVIFSAVVAIFAAFAASASAAPLLWALNKDADAVSTIDTSTGRIVGAPIPVGERPESIAITPDGRAVLVANYDGKSITVIDAVAKAAVATIPLSGHAEQVAISPSGALAYVTVEGSKEIAVIDTATAKAVGTIAVAESASTIAVAPDGKHLYVSSGKESIQVVDTQTGLVVGAPIHVGEFPESIVFTPNGRTAYVSSEVSKSITVIDTALGQAIGSILVAGEPDGLAVAPDGSRLYVADELDGTVLAYETEGNRLVGKPIPTGTETQYVAITPDGRTAYVSAAGEEAVTPINLATGEAQKPIKFVGETADLAVAPDQSPTAAFTAPSATEAVPAAFSGAASTDPDGFVAAWTWSFGDGGVGSGVEVSHVYGAAGSYAAKLSVVDNEGCGTEEVFTGRTAYCSGNLAGTVAHPVSVAPLPPTPESIVCSSAVRIGRVVHNRRNGTVRLQVKVPATGSLFLFGKKIHAVSRKSVRAGSTFLTLHARVEVNKRLKKTHQTGVRYRVTFYPAAKCSPVALHGSLALQRAPRKNHRAS